MSASLIDRSRSSVFRRSTALVSMSLTGSCLSSDSALRLFQDGIRERGGTIFRSAVPSAWWQADMTFCDANVCDTSRGRYLRIGFFSFVSPTEKSKSWQAIARRCGLSLLGIDQWPGYCRCKSGPQHGWTKWLLRVLQKLTRASFSHPSKTTAHATP